MKNIRAHGPWVLVDPEPSPKITMGLYVPDGNLMERLGHVVGKVISVGKGYYTVLDNKKRVFIPIEVAPGDRVVFRGHLQEHNLVSGTKHCFMHAQDLMGILDKDAKLNLALPHGN